MQEIIAIVNRRGGVGKTATAHAIGAGLGREGYKVLYIDLDSQCNLTYDVGAQTAPLTAMEVLGGTATAEEAIQHLEGADLIPASPSLAVADTTIEGTGKEHRLREALETVAGRYDYAIIDTPPALGVLTVNALTACNSAVIPAQAEVHSLQGIGLLYEAIRAVQKYTNPALTIKGILITRYSGRAILSQTVRQDLQETAKTLKTRLYTEPIRECVTIKEAAIVQQNIFDYAPKSKAAKDYDSFINEFLTKKGR